MADDKNTFPGFNWTEAVALLDANFIFRSIPDKEGARSYRLTSNGSAIHAKPTANGALINLPMEVPDLEEATSATGLPTKVGGYQYIVRSISELEKAVMLLRGAVSAASVINSSPILVLEQSSQAELHQMSQCHATNTILYGPPGTGKTYRTAELAVELCDGAAPPGREAIMQRYEALRRDGRIAFVTFHQSFSYEDFVEGLRPEVKDGQVIYDVRPGIFREICDAAKLSWSAEPGLKSGEPIRDRTVFKMSLGETGSVEGRRVFQESMEAGRILLGWGRDVDFSACNSSEELRKQFIESYPSDEGVESNVKYVDVFKNAVKKGDLVVASQGNRAYRAIGEVTGPYEFQEEGTFHQSRLVRWLAILDGNHPVSEIYGRNFTQSTLYELDKSVINYQALEKLIQKNAEGTSRAFVLVIDEINRANISKVFGELITLLETDKREGSLNALTVKLPYSGKDFSVPSNLHIVGTMNTADRSIALLDTALRRRFMFEELMPVPTKIANAVPGVDLQKLLKAMNERIEALYDRDHTIGHAYLMHASSLAELNSIFRHKILPLLQEYFHEDWSRIRRVLNDLGDGVFISKAPRAPVPGEESDTYDSESRQIYQVNRTEFPAEAFRQIYEG